MYIKKKESERERERESKKDGDQRTPKDTFSLLSKK